MITEEFKQLVREEAEKLRILATEEERSKLDFDTFDPGDASHCVYGQMTGHCRSKRALSLLTRCAVPYLESKEDARAGKGAEFHLHHLDNFSPIEVYIMYPEAKNPNLLAYLKGETDTLEL